MTVKCAALTYAYLVLQKSTDQDLINTMKALKLFDRIVDGLRRFVLAALLIAIISLCTTNIILRYLNNANSTLRPFPWVDAQRLPGGCDGRAGAFRRAWRHGDFREFNASWVRRHR